jgi:hypothetical protein
MVHEAVERAAREAALREGRVHIKPRQPPEPPAEAVERVEGETIQDEQQGKESMANSNGSNGANETRRHGAVSPSPPGPPNPFVLGEISAHDLDELPEADGVEHLWFGLYPAGVTLLNGETGAGKTSLLYNVAVHAARNAPLWGMEFGLGRPLSVYYVDPENAGRYSGYPRTAGLCLKKIRRIAQGLPRHLIFHEGQRVNLALAEYADALAERLLAGIGGQPFDLLVIDPVSALFGVKDENDNAAMQRVMDTLRHIARRTGAAVVAAHHTGKSSVYGGVMSGRGASSMPGGADVVMTWRVRGEDEEEHEGDFDGKPKERTGICRMRIEKDRVGSFGKGASLYLKMAGNDRFERVGAAEWRSRRTSENGPTSLEAAKDWVKGHLRDDGNATRRALEEKRRAGKPGFGENALEEALKSLSEEGAIHVVETRARNEKVYAITDPFAEN